MHIFINSFINELPTIFPLTLESTTISSICPATSPLILFSTTTLPYATTLELYIPTIAFELELEEKLSHAVFLSIEDKSIFFN